jgi:hypothetical protein
MHLPVGPARSTEAPLRGSPDPSGRLPGTGDRARLDQFRLRRGLAAEEAPSYAAGRLQGGKAGGGVGRSFPGSEGAAQAELVEAGTVAGPGAPAGGVRGTPAGCLGGSCGTNRQVHVATSAHQASCARRRRGSLS